MADKNYSITELSQKHNFETFIQSAADVCKRLFEGSFSHLGIKEYIYDINEAVKELGLNAELVKEFVEEYMIQILESKKIFLECIEKLEQDKNENKRLDYIPLRQLAHKNLGVARNLRIKSAEKILFELSKSDDLEYLKECLEALDACTVSLNPRHAYNTLKLLTIKDSI